MRRAIACVPTDLTLEALEIFGSQAAIAIENRLQLRELQEQLALAQSQRHNAHKSAMPDELEQIRRRTQRIQTGLDIAEAVNRQRTRGDVLLSLGRGLLEQGEFAAAIIAEASRTRIPEPDGIEPHNPEPRLVGMLGDIPEEVNPEALLGQRNPLRQSLQKNELLFIPDLEQTELWKNAPLLTSAERTGFYLSAGCSSIAGSEAAILGIGREALSHSSTEDEQLYA